MIGRPRRVFVMIAVGLFAAVHVLLALTHQVGRTSDPVPYYVALVLAVGACVAILMDPPPGLETVVAAGITAAVVSAALLVLAVLPAGAPSYAMWYPALIAVPMGGLALRGHPVLGVAGAAVSAVITLVWSATASGMGTEGLVEGLYRVTTPTAAVVLCVGIAVLMRSSRDDIDRANAERVAASEFSAAVRARELERADRIADVSRLATPVLARLAAGDPPGRRLVSECRLLEGRLRDGIRGRGLVDSTVSAAAWAARSRGVNVFLLDDAGSEAGTDGTDDRFGREILRSALARSIEAVSVGQVTGRLVPQPGPVLGTVVVVSAEAEFAAAAVAKLPRVSVDLGEDEAVITVRALLPDA